MNTVEYSIQRQRKIGIATAMIDQAMSECEEELTLVEWATIFSNKLDRCLSLALRDELKDDAETADEVDIQS